MPDTILAPGPVNLHPEVLKEISKPALHHRTPEFRRILDETLHLLAKVFQTDQPCFILSGTGSAGMEALVVNTIKPGDSVLCINSGKFGERWRDMACIYGARVVDLRVPWGEAVTIEEIAAEFHQAQQRGSPFRAVLTQACETSTAVLHPIQKIGEWIHQNAPDCLLLVDGITALGAVDLPMDRWHIDGLVGGSQKAFALPTGLSFVSLSKKAWETLPNEGQQPRFYFDLRKEWSANQKSDTYFSAPVSLIRGLNVSLKIMLKNGLQHFLSQISLRAKTVRALGRALGLTEFSKAPSASLTAFVTPYPSEKLRDELENEFKVTVMGGQDQLKNKILRVGHMGYITPEDHHRLFTGLWQLLQRRGVGGLPSQDELEKLIHEQENEP